MKILHESQIDISGFASVRERVLLQSREFFRHEPAPETFGQFGSLLYLANAWFTPHGSTKLHHHHEGVDIVSVIPRGEMFHEGTIGDKQRVLGGQVQIQRSGKLGFSHNEINPTDQPQSFIQLWFAPEQIDEQASFELVDINKAGLTAIYQSNNTQLTALNLNMNERLSIKGGALLFVYAGHGEVANSNERQLVERGSLVLLPAGYAYVLGGLKALLISKNSHR